MPVFQQIEDLTISNLVTRSKNLTRDDGLIIAQTATMQVDKYMAPLKSREKKLIKVEILIRCTISGWLSKSRDQARRKVKTARPVHLSLVFSKLLFISEVTYFPLFIKILFYLIFILVTLK